MFLFFLLTGRLVRQCARKFRSRGCAQYALAHRHTHTPTHTPVAHEPLAKKRAGPSHPQLFLFVFLLLSFWSLSLSLLSLSLVVVGCCWLLVVGCWLLLLSLLLLLLLLLSSLLWSLLWSSSSWLLLL